MLLPALSRGARATDVERLSYYCSSYEACRATFLADVQRFLETLPSEDRARAEQHVWKVPSEADDDLTANYFYLPAKEQAKNLIVLTSGVHGIEGFVGNAAQRLFLKEILPTLDLSQTGILLIHAINPFGMKYFRRVDEFNRDLGRNFELTRALFTMPNPEYSKMSPVLNPQTRASANLLARFRFLFGTGYFLARTSLKELRQAILQGQYHDPSGIYFGGSDFSPQRDWLKELLETTARPYANVMLGDFHTGYGNRGKLHLFEPALLPSAVLGNLRKLYRGLPTDAASSDDFYQNFGDFANFVTELLVGQGKNVFPMTWEYGTVNNLGTAGALESLWRMVTENQRHHFGATSDASKRSISAQFLGLFFPREKKWRAGILEQTYQQMALIAQRFTQYGQCVDKIAAQK